MEAVHGGGEQGMYDVFYVHNFDNLHPEQRDYAINGGDEGAGFHWGNCGSGRP
jgi:hypothetical protein